MKDLETIYENMTTAQFYAGSGHESKELRDTKLTAQHVHNLENLIEQLQDKRLKGQLRYEIRFIKEFINEMVNMHQSKI